MKTVRDFFVLQNHCRWWLQPWIKRCLFLGRKAMTNLESALKSRNITLLTKVHLVKAMVFSCSLIWIWEVDHKESWIIDAFELWCWRRLLRVPARDCKEIKPDNPKENQSLIFIGSSGSWWWTGKPGVLQSTGSQRIRHDLATELNNSIWTYCVD